MKTGKYIAVTALLFWTANAFAEESPVAKPSANIGSPPMGELNSLTGKSLATKPSAEFGTPPGPSEAKPLRDPTVMSPRFREALKNMSPQAAQSTPTGQGNNAPPPAPKLPIIRLLGLISGNGKQASALLGIGKEQKLYLINNVGDEISLEDEDSPEGLVTIEVKAVTGLEVQLLLKPLNKKIILR